MLYGLSSCSGLYEQVAQCGTLPHLRLASFPVVLYSSAHGGAELGTALLVTRTGLTQSQVLQFWAYLSIAWT